MLMLCFNLKKALPYPLLSDRNRLLITALGAGAGGKTKRSHFIFEKGGKLIDKKIPVKPLDRLVLALSRHSQLQIAHRSLFQPQTST
jgi:peroxiredoxin